MDRPFNGESTLVAQINGDSDTALGGGGRGFGGGRRGGGTETWRGGFDFDGGE